MSTAGLTEELINAAVESRALVHKNRNPRGKRNDKIALYSLLICVEASNR